MTVLDQVTAARAAAHRLATVSDAVKARAITRMASLLGERSAEVLKANAADCAAATKARLAQPLLNRLVLSSEKIAAMRESLLSVAALPDPVGRVELRRELADGLVLEKVRVPIGVIGVVFESRPDALVQIASLAVRSGNAVILKGGSEARESNSILHALFVEALEATDAAFDGALQLVQTREQVTAVLALDREIDLMIPRGSSELVRYIQENTRIPVLGHAEGVCHLYIDSAADDAMAIALTVDAKTQYPAVCNAIETLLVHEAKIGVLSAVRSAMPSVELRGCPRTREVIDVQPATDEDWRTEYNDLILSVRVVSSLGEAIAHINAFGSHHTDAIVTSDEASARRFLREVDSASVLWNASTRFADGFRYGLGAEVGIATGKLHARGPVGLDGLTTTQYRVSGAGHAVAPFVSGEKLFTHREIE